MNITYQVWVKLNNAWFCPDDSFFIEPSVEIVKDVAKQIRLGCKVFKLAAYIEQQHCPDLDILPLD